MALISDVFRNFLQTINQFVSRLFEKGSNECLVEKISLLKLAGFIPPWGPKTLPYYYVLKVGEPFSENTRSIAHIFTTSCIRIIFIGGERVIYILASVCEPTINFTNTLPSITKCGVNGMVRPKPDITGGANISTQALLFHLVPIHFAVMLYKYDL